MTIMMMSCFTDHFSVTMTEDDKVFFKELGERITAYRKEQSLTQTQLGKVLSMSQQNIAAFENGTRKVPASLLPTLAQLFGVSLEALLGQKEKPGKRGPTPKLLRQVEQLSYLPKSKQKFVMEMLDTVIKQQAANWLSWLKKKIINTKHHVVNHQLSRQ